ADAPPGGAVRRGTARLGEHRIAVCQWDFAVDGGSFAAVDAETFATACADDLPLVTLVRSGGTRLTEGMRALVGIPRAALALADRRRPHVCVVDQPTTGG